MSKDIIVKLRLAAEDFARGARQEFQEIKYEAEKAGAETSEGFTKGFNSKKAALIGAVSAAGVLAVEGIRRSLDLAKDLDTTSKQIGVSVEELQKYRFAASKAGVTTSEFDGNISNLTRTIGDANAGTRSAQQAFVNLGVGFVTTEGQARSTESVLQDIAKRLLEIDDPSERARLGTQLLGDEFTRLNPMLPELADGMRGATSEMLQYGGALSAEEIKNLNQLNNDLERMKNILSVSVASTVAENSDSISNFAQGLSFLADKAIQVTAALGNLYAVWVGDEVIREESGFFGSLMAGPRGALRAGREELKYGNRGAFDELTDYEREQTRLAVYGPTGVPRVTGTAAAPRVSPVATRRGGGSSRRRVGGGGGGGKSDAQRERERQDKDAAQAEERFTKAIQRTIQEQEDSARIEQIRLDLGEAAAKEAEARLDYIRQNPLAVANTVEEMKKMLGLTRALTAEERERYQLLIDQSNAAEDAIAKKASKQVGEEEEKARQRVLEEQKQDAKRLAEILRREHEAAIMDVADIYEDLFTNGVDSVWDNFRREGLRIVAEIAAQWTLAMIAGQKFDLNGAAGAAMGRSPLAALFGGVGNVFGAANDNQAARAGAQIGQGARGVFGAIGGLAGGGGNEIVVTGRAQGGSAGAAGAGGDLLDQVGFTLAASGIGSLIGGNSGTAGAIGSTAGALGGRALGKLIGGPVGGKIGSVLGSIAGNLLGGLFTKTPRGSANLTGLDQFTLSGNNKGGAQDTASGLAGSVSEGLRGIAEALGGNVGRFAVSIGQSGDSVHVDPDGTGRLKKSQGGLDFNQDQQAAIEFAIRDAIADGAIQGISAAAQRILKSGQNLETAIEKAVMIESIPRLLKERFDPLGGAMDALYDRFKKLADVLKEGGASAEQIADARQLWELEKADAIASIGSASAELKDFLLSLNAGSNSPLSLRQQRVEAETQLATYETQIAEAQAARAEVERLKAAGASDSEISAAEQAARIAAGKIDQSGFAQASQLLLGIDRGINASGAGFFDTFDRIRNLTTSAIGLVDGAQPGVDGRDPFAELTATNTSDMVNLMVDTNNLLRAINDNIGGGGGSGVSERFFTQSRAFMR